MTIKQNRLLVGVITSLVAYWIIGSFLPGVVLSVGLGVFSLLIGLAILIRYSRGMYEVLVKGARSEVQDGAHLAVIGIPAIAGAIVYGGLFTLFWNLEGQPESWLATPASNFSRLLLVMGCVALYLTPDVDKQRLSLPGLTWLAVLGLAAVITAFLLGTYIGADKLSDRVRYRPLQMDGGVSPVQPQPVAPPYILPPGEGARLPDAGPALREPPPR